MPLKNMEIIVKLTFTTVTVQSVELFTKRRNCRHVKTENICRQQIECDSKSEICFGKAKKHCGKRRKCWSPAFSPFPTIFSKGQGS